MNQELSMEQKDNEKFIKMTQTPVEKLVCTLAVPTIISMMISSIYNMADTFFVGKIGTSATGAVGISFALMAIIQAVGFTLGIGSGNYVSRLLGQRNRQYASNIVSTAVLTALGVGLFLGVLGLIFINPLVRILGATDTIFPYAKAYVRYILIGTPYMMAAFVMNNILRFQGSSFYAMLGIGTGGVLNIILDPIFIFTFHMGTAGAALATIISQFISFLILLHNCAVGGNIKVTIKDFTPKWSIYREILRNGLPSFYRQSLSSISMICLNFSAHPYGDAAIAAMSIVTRVFQFALSALLGFGQGFQPVCGFNYGARLYRRVLDAFWFCVKLAAVVLVLMGILGYMFAPQIIAIFRKEDLEVIEIGTWALRYQCITFPLASWIIINNMFLQTIGKSGKASILSLSRQGLFFLPAIFILPRFFGIMGVQISQPVADICSFLIAIPLGISTLRELRSECNHPKEALK